MAFGPAKEIVTFPDGQVLADRLTSTPILVPEQPGKGPPSRGLAAVATGPQISYIRIRGIQYAEHPVGKLRFQPPIERGSWKGVADGTRFGHDCPNLPWLSRLLSLGLDRMGEACLYLNIYAPARPTNGTKLPVLFWLYGGSFVSGGSSVYPADEWMRSRQDVIVVTHNYRLGALGFLGGPAVGAASADRSSGNFGLQDSRAALRWVRRNIGALNGDAERITIFGESAGSSMVACLLVMPKNAEG